MVANLYLFIAAVVTFVLTSSLSMAGYKLKRMIALALPVAAIKTAWRLP